MIYVILTVVATGLALLIRNEEYALLRSGAGYAPGEYRPWNREQARNGVLEAAVYFLMAGVSACRIAVGNDYWVYRDNFRLIAEGRHVSSEIGFNLVVKFLVGFFGYDEYLPVFGFFSLITVYFFVRALHDQGKYYAFSLFLLFAEGFYFNSLNTVRYYLALAMALFAMKYVLQRKWEQFIVFVLVGALFHKSILIVLPVYAVAYYLAKTRLRLWHGILGGAFLASLLFGQDLYRWVIFRIYPFYENSHFDQSRLSYKNLALALGTVLLCGIVWFARRGMKGQEDYLPLRFYAVLNGMGLVAFCCGGFVPEVTRIGYYMTISQVFLIPGMVAEIPQKWLRRVCFIGTVGVFTLHFALLLKQMYLVDIRLLPYLNWIFN